MSENTHCPCCLLSYGVFINFEKSDLFDVKSSFFHGSCLVLTHNPQGRWCVVRRNQATVTKEANLEDKTDTVLLLSLSSYMFCLFVDVQINSRPKRDLNFASWPQLEGPRRNSTSVSVTCCGGRRSGGGGGGLFLLLPPSQPTLFLPHSFFSCSPLCLVTGTF